VNQPSPPTETATPEILVPPRPNLGPEPWDGDGWSAWASPALALAAAAALTWLEWRARGRRRSSRLPPPPADDAPPEERLLALCDRLRADLAERLGPTLRARTTEELAADPRVAELLGADLPRLAEILGAGDRFKFARRPAADLADRLPEWTAWAASRR